MTLISTMARSAGYLLVATVMAAGCAIPSPSLVPPSASAVGDIIAEDPRPPLPAEPKTAPFPGTRWTIHGEPAEFGSITLTSGPLVCGYQDLQLLTIGWPLGTVPRTDRFARQYVRDPGDRFRERMLADFLEAAELPAGAFDTGYRYGADELWVSVETVDRMIFLVRGPVIEQWPRARELLACA